jgi:hypothetical protein
MTPVDEQPSSPAPIIDRPADAAPDEAAAEQQQGTPTAAQLRRFIKSRPYVPLHELRRRFELNGDLDEVTPIRTLDGLTVFVGLPERESRLLGDLARDGDIGLELARDPHVPIVVGVYPIRPVGRG